MSDRGTAVVGAGWLGAEVARALAGRVVATTRSGLDVMADVIDVSAIAACDRFAITIAPGDDAVDRRAFYVEGAKRLLTAVLAPHVRRVVWVSSTSALPDVDGWVDESEQAWPTAPRGVVQREAEAVVAAACEAAGVPWLVLRMGGLYGPGRELARIYAQREPLAGDGMTATNLVHRDDAVAAVVAALAAPPEVTGIVHVVDDDHCSRSEMFEALAREHGRPPPRWELDADSHAPVRGKRVRADRLRRDLGVVLRHPTHGGGGAS